MSMPQILLPPTHPGLPTLRLPSVFSSIDNMKRALSTSFNKTRISTMEVSESRDIDSLHSTCQKTSSIDDITQQHDEDPTKKLTPREKVNLIIRQVSARNKLRLKYKHEQDQIDIEKTLEHIKASDTVFYKNGKEMWSREIQTLDLHHGLDLSEADHIAKSIRKDIELNRFVIEVNCKVKLKESRVLLYTIMSRRLKEVERQYNGRIHEIEKGLKGKLKSDVESAQTVFETQNKKTLADATETMKFEVEKRRRILETFQDQYRQNNQEFQTLRYKSAKLYLLLKRHNIPGVQETNEHLDAQRLEIVSMVDKLRSEIIKCDEEIRTLQPKIFKLEEEVDVINQKNKKEVVGIVQDGTTGSKYVKLENQLGEAPAYMADDKTRNYVMLKLEKDFESHLQNCVSGVKREYEELQKAKDGVGSHWDVKFKSAETMFNAEKLSKVMQRQQRLLKLVGKVVTEEQKRQRKDQYARCALTGRTIVELLKKEEKEFKAKFEPVLALIPLAVKERTKRKMMEVERKVAAELAAQEAAAAALVEQQLQESLMRAKQQLAIRKEMQFPSLAARRGSFISAPPPLQPEEKESMNSLTVTQRERTCSILTPSAVSVFFIKISHAH
ncbi:UNVERIFIED_CONTAM: hypothetical protein HDU68_003597 [Siphonaria sp. JEL0065]|nr:hypothetical protein HDU68_003597 [Siphonaria sp. JEL0065]